jgi:putative tryptophan/tyrosine transport system substrate-binding protein
MHRRAFLGTLAGGLLAVPLAAEDQQTTGLPRVGHLAIAGPNSTPQPPPENWDAFLAALREGGYEEGKTFTFEHRDARNRPELFRAAAAELVRAKVAVIFARGGHAVRAAKQATNTIPIVAIDLETDPIVAHFVQSLARPGGNVTGLTTQIGGLKLYQLLNEAVPKVSRVAYLYDPASSVGGAERAIAAAQAANVDLQMVALRDPNDIAQAFAEFRRGTNGLLLDRAVILQLRQDQICKLALQHRLPTAAAGRSFVEAGCLVYYGENLAAMHRRAAVYVDKIFRGAKPGDLPVEQPTKFELVINLKTAKALGLTIPPSLLGRADEVIQ